MKRFLLATLLIIAAITLKAEDISVIERSGSWYYLYDANGRRYKTIPAQPVGEIKGWSSTFFVSQNGSWIYLYDANGRRYKTLPTNPIGQIISVTSGGFVARNGSWIRTYDTQGKHISTRPASH